MLRRRGAQGHRHKGTKVEREKLKGGRMMDEGPDEIAESISRGKDGGFGSRLGRWVGPDVHPR